MNQQKRARARQAALGGMIAAIYAVTALINIPVGFFQIRPSEALTALPVLTPAAIPGLTLGCILANYLTGCLWQDILFGSLATLLGAIGTRLLRKRPVLALCAPVISNALIIPPVTVLAYGVKGGYFPMLLSVTVGEVVCCLLLGMFLLGALKKIQDTGISL